VPDYESRVITGVAGMKARMILRAKLIRLSLL
jgi:hypothetical protein